MAFAQEGPYDLILKGGHVIDPRNGVDAVRDVAIRGAKIVAVGTNLPGAAKKGIDVSGLYVTPGLVDIHVHVFWGDQTRGLGERGPQCAAGRSRVPNRRHDYGRRGHFRLARLSGVPPADHRHGTNSGSGTD